MFSIEDTDDDVGVADVDSEQHGGECMHHPRVIGLIDIGGTKLAAARAAAPIDATAAPRLTNMRRSATPSDQPLAALTQLLDQVLDGQRPECISASVPGPFDRRGAALIDPPGMPEAWHRLRIGDELQRRYGCTVVMENDANCAALAEARWGAGAGARTVVYFTVSTGIGTGIVCDGVLWTGRHDTEGGHQVLWPDWLGGPKCHCGGAGCLEALASGLAIERRFGRKGQDLDDPDAWREVGRWLGLGASNAIALLDPDVVVFGGGVCASWERFEPGLRETVAAHVRLQELPRITSGALGEERNLLGALALAASSTRD
jgi:glucokinase